MGIAAISRASRVRENRTGGSPDHATHWCGSTPAPHFLGIRVVDELDAVLVAAAVERGVEPSIDDGEKVGFGDHAFAEGEDVGIVVSAG